MDDLLRAAKLQKRHPVGKMIAGSIFLLIAWGCYAAWSHLPKKPIPLPRKIVATETRSLPTHTDHFVAPVESYSQPIIILGADWEFDTYGSYNGNDNPSLLVIVNQGRGDERVVKLGGGKHAKLGSGIYTLRFKSGEAGPVAGYVLQKRRHY